MASVKAKDDGCSLQSWTKKKDLRPIFVGAQQRGLQRRCGLYFDDYNSNVFTAEAEAEFSVASLEYVESGG